MTRRLAPVLGPFLVALLFAALLAVAGAPLYTAFGFAVLLYMQTRHAGMAVSR